jgi:hypothetical protein
LVRSPFEGGMQWRGATLDLSSIALGHGVSLSAAPATWNA